MTFMPKDKATPAERDIETLREDMQALRTGMRNDLKEIRRDVAHLSRDAAGAAPKVAVTRGLGSAELVGHSIERRPFISTFSAFIFGPGGGFLLGQQMAKR